MTETVKTKTSNAIVLIYNYADRLGSKDIGGNAYNIDQIILNSASLISVSTQKSKGNPAGAFEIKLAPTKNWVTAITPGSWCVILMSNNKLDDTAKYGGGYVDEESFKMLGRIESVRSIINTDQGTGARRTEYVATGSDWGVIFNSNFYVDPVSRPKDITAVGMAERLTYDKYLNSVSFEITKTTNKENITENYVQDNNVNDTVKEGRKKEAEFFAKFDPFGLSEENAENTADDTAGSGVIDKRRDPKPVLPTSTYNIDFLLSFWGQDDPTTSQLQEGSKGKLLGKSKQKFKIPDKLAKYMKLKDKNGKTSGTIAQIIQQKSGRLISTDKYTDNDRAAGLIDFNTIFGQHTMWQIINSNTNSIMNEVIPEVRFENGIPKLTVYNRNMPFCVNKLTDIKKSAPKKEDLSGSNEFDSNIIDEFYSQYKHIRTKMIDGEDVIMCNYGTNWRDRLNFIEVNLSRSLFKEAYSPDIKLQSQVRDEKSIGRDGLLSMITETQYIPLNKKNQILPLSIFAYKSLLKEWYFDTHKMFNGTMYMIGQDQYIQVGDNIMVESRVLNLESFNNNYKQRSTKPKTYLLAHVQSIQHQTSVDANGTRVFTTTIDFVRGVLVDRNRNLVVSDDIAGAVDQDASKTTPSIERNRHVFGTSTSNDPDRQYLDASKVRRNNKKED